jgi:DNA-binding NarL/FixJ family response regulator
VIANESLGPIGGTNFLSDVLRQYPASVRILMTTGTDPASLIDAVNEAEIYRFLSPSLCPEQTTKVLRGALHLARVVDAQKSVWHATRQHQDAVQKLVDAQADSDAPYAQASNRLSWGGQNSNWNGCDPIGELPDEFARRLSTRENDIVHALGSGKRVKAIALSLSISAHTVRNHLKAIYRKLSVRSQFELLSLMARRSIEH